MDVKQSMMMLSVHWLLDMVTGLSAHLSLPPSLSLPVSLSVCLSVCSRFTSSRHVIFTCAVVRLEVIVCGLICSCDTTV